MENWLEIVIRQMVLYSLPVLISLTLVVYLEARLHKQTMPHPFYAISNHHVWLPFIASLAFNRGIIIAMPQGINNQVLASSYRLLSHIILCFFGFLLYTWVLQHRAPTGLPPLHHWWAKVFMYFNLCMACLHILPLPSLLAGELLLKRLQRQHPAWHHWLTHHHITPWVITILAASPLLDWGLGKLIFPIYESMATQALLQS